MSRGRILVGKGSQLMLKSYPTSISESQQTHTKQHAYLLYNKHWNVFNTYCADISNVCVACV